MNRSLSRLCRGRQRGLFSVSFSSSVDEAERAKFNSIGSSWWDTTRGNPVGPLHDMNPVRVEYLAHHAVRNLSPSSMPSPRAQGDHTNGPLAGLRILDVGCGGGLLCEPLARLGASVTGIDVGENNIAVAEEHAALDTLTASIEYHHTTVEHLAESTENLYDLVCCLEVVEHVASLSSFVQACASLVKPGGGMAFSTINRTVKSYALAIVGAEYLTQVVPVGTHDWHKFVTPEELEAELTAAGTCIVDVTGMTYRPSPFRRTPWRFDPTDHDVNYICFGVKA